MIGGGGEKAGILGFVDILGRALFVDPSQPIHLHIRSARNYVLDFQPYTRV